MKQLSCSRISFRDGLHEFDKSSFSSGRITSWSKPSVKQTCRIGWKKSRIIGRVVRNYLGDDS
jgi:hypothetical protein